MKTVDELAASLGPVLFRELDLWRVAIPMTEPFRISSGEVSNKEALVVRASDGTAFGWGESSSMPGSFYSAETPDTCHQELVGRVLPALAGRAFRSLAELNEFLKEFTPAAFVRVAIETAAWEMMARGRGLSLRALLGLEERPIPSGLAVGLYDTEDQLCAAIRRWGPQPYQRLKIKIKRGQDVALVRRVRREFGDIPLFVDANADYTREDFAVLRELDAYKLMMFEQPLAKHDLEASAELQRQVRTPVCLDESIESAEDARKALDMGACRIINIKIQRVGGFLEALRIAEVCAARGVPAWMGTMPELGIGSVQAWMLAAHPAFQFPSDVESSARWFSDDLVQPALVVSSDGCLHGPAAPGLGFEVDRAKLECYATARAHFS